MRDCCTKYRWLIYAAILFGVALVVGWRARVWDWDAIAYAACVEELGGGTAQEVHAAVYDELRRIAPAEVVERLCGGNEYREAMATDAGAFAAQLPFYRGRVLLIGVLAGLDRLGVSPLHGIFWLSFLSGVVLATLLAFWASRFPRPDLASLFAVAWLVATGWPETLAMATPDTLAAVLIFAGAFLLLRTRYLFLALVLLGLSLAVRVDHIIFIGPLLLLRGFHPRHERVLSIRTLAVTLVVYAGVVLLCTVGRGTYGWWAVFHHTFVEYMTDPVAQTPAMDLGFWFDRTLHSLPMFKAWQPLLTTLVGLVAIGIGFRELRWRSLGAGLAAAALIGVGVHFVIFPALWPRLFLSHWALIGVALLMVLAERRRAPA